MNKEHIKQQYIRIAKNFMTPDVRDWELLEDGRIIELSEGFGMNNNKIFGVTEFKEEDGRLQTTRRGQMHNTLISARKHYNSLKS